MRRMLTVLAATVLTGLAAAASAAAQGAATVGLNPDTVSAAPTAQVSIAGVTGYTTLPTSLEILLQPGFTSSIKSVTALCSGTAASTSNCPSASQVGTGTVQVSYLGSPASVTVALFLGPPQQSGDIASLVLVGSFDGTAVNGTGRIFTPSGGGLEVLITGFPALPLTLSSFSVSLAAQQSQTEHITKTITRIVYRKVYRGKGKHRHKVRVKHVIRHKVHETINVVYSIVTNPSKCSGTWTGSAILTFPMGTDTLPLSSACTT